MRAATRGAQPDVPACGVVTDESACRVVTTELSTRILLRKQLAALSERRWTVVSGDVPGAVLPGIEQIRIPMSREPAFSDLKSFAALWRFFRRRRFAFVQTHTPKASLLALPAARLAGQRTIYTMHGGLYFRDNSRKANLAGWVFERWCCSWAHLVAMQSAEDVEVLVRVHACPKRKARHLGNGIDASHFRGALRDRPPSHRPVVLMIARLVAEKGCLEFFDIAEALHDLAEFVHVGPVERDQRDAVDPARSEDLAGRGVVRFVGDVDDVRPYLAEADLFVLPSFREGIPRAAMEAAASGLPVAAYDVRGVREVVAPGLGLLAPRGDTAAITAIVEALVTDADLRSRAAAACQAHVLAGFDERKVVERVRAIYGELEGIGDPGASVVATEGAGTGPGSGAAAD